MSMMNKIKSMLRGHESKAEKGIDMAGAMFDRKTRGKYRRHVDKAQRKLKDELTRPQSGEPGTRPGQGPQGPHGGHGPGHGDPQGPQSGQGGPYGNPYGGQGRPPQT